MRCLSVVRACYFSTFTFEAATCLDFLFNPALIVFYLVLATAVLLLLWYCAGLLVRACDNFSCFCWSAYERLLPSSLALASLQQL